MWIFLLITILCWGITPFIEKYALQNIDPIDGLFVRCVGVFIIFSLFYIFSGRIKNVFDMPLKNIGLFILSGILAGLVGMYFYFKVLKISPTSKIVPLASVYPLITAILGIIIFKEGIGWSRIVGTILIVIGVLLVK